MPRLVDGFARVLVAGVCLAFLSAARPAAASPFTFAGQTFEENNTPDTIAWLGGGNVYGGVAFSAGNPISQTPTSGSGGAGFTGTSPTDIDKNLTLGVQANQQLPPFPSSVSPAPNLLNMGSFAVNLPAGNNDVPPGGTVRDLKRHGIQVGWENQRTLLNGAGSEFVIYESGGPTGPEALMVRVRRTTGAYTDWYYGASSAFQFYSGSTTEGAFALVYDLDLLGVASGGAIDLIEMANMLPNDRILGTAGGFASAGSVDAVDVGDPATAGLAQPGRGPNFTTQLYPDGSFDPDPLYVGILSTSFVSPAILPPSGAVPEPTSLAVLLFGLGALLRRRRS